jgi:hypothetical protein
MISDHDTLSLVDEAIAHLDQALEALRRIPREGEQALTVDGIAHELHELMPRLHALGDTVAGAGNGAA